ncbi:MAG: hypothetical protein J6X70_03030 [Muribaculaceae bacterium]|nr:hypothetical protein [Muribaculaceae bacterium]
MDAPYLEKPRNIGEIIFCETTKPKAAFERNNTGTAIWTVVCLLFAALMGWLTYLFPDNSGWFITGLIVALIVAACVLYYNTPGSFSGTDMFVGTDGFSYYKFKRDRANKTEMQTFYFKDMVICRSGRTKHYKNNSYQGTEAKFFFFFAGPNGVHTFPKKVTFRDEKHYPPTTSDPASAETRWLYMVEQRWNDIIIPRLMHEVFEMNHVVNFNSNSGIIEVWRDGMRVGGKQYLRGEVGNIYPENGVLIIEHSNFEKGFFKNKGDRARIDMADLDNPAAFLALMENIFGK